MICTLTINPAIDKLLFVSRFQRDNTNRIVRSMDVLGGKGTHVSTNLRILNCDNRAYGIGFGKTGRKIEEMLKSQGVDVRFLHYETGESRTNYALIEENHKCSLITERGDMISSGICEKLLDILEESLKDGDDLVLSGDASNTEIPYIYNVIMERLALAGKKIRIYLDTSSGNLIRGIEKKPFLVKPNVDELSQVVGKALTSEADILDGIFQIASKGIECVAVSRGGDGSIVKYRELIYQVEALQVDVKNTIGCGDAFLSGMVYGFSREMEFEEILKLATGISAATAESELTVGFDYERAMELKEQVKMKRLTVHRNDGKEQLRSFL